MNLHGLRLFGLGILPFLGLLIFIAGCSKTDEGNNIIPSFSITSPLNGDDILQGEDILITVDVNDVDNTIVEVLFKIDNVQMGLSYARPYNYKWNTNGMEIGMHTIKAIVKDKGGKAVSTEIEICLIEEGSNVKETGTVSDYDGNIYNTIKIGNQWWMSENLKTKHFSDGSEIALVEDNLRWDSLGDMDIAYSYYDHSSSNANSYGALYTWAAAMNGAASTDAVPSDVQGVCPSGWHLPSDFEWMVLEKYLGMSEDEAMAFHWRGTNEGNKLKTRSGWYNNGNGSNTSGFSALPGGLRLPTGAFIELGKTTKFWTATEISINNFSYAWNRSLSNSNSQVGQFLGHHFYGLPKDHGLSVRCVKD